MISSELPELIGICDRIYTVSYGVVTDNVEKNGFTQEYLMKGMTKEREVGSLMSAATATPAKKEEKTGLLATVANNARQYGIVGALLVIVVAFEVLTGGVLLKPNSFVSLIQQNAYVIILAIGMVMVISPPTSTFRVGCLVAFIGGVCALLMERAGVNWMLAIVIALVVGLIVGVWQGF